MIEDWGRVVRTTQGSFTRALLKAVDAWVQVYECPADLAYAETDSLQHEDVAPSKAEFAGTPLHLKSTKHILTKCKPNYYPKEHLEMVLTEIDCTPVNKQGTRALDVHARETNAMQFLQTHSCSQAQSETTNLVDFICENCEAYNVLDCQEHDEYQHGSQDGPQGRRRCNNIVPQSVPLVCEICGSRQLFLESRVFRCIWDLDDLRDDTNLANLAASFWNSLSPSSKTRHDIVNREKGDRLKRQHTTSSAISSYDHHI